MRYILMFGFGGGALYLAFLSGRTDWGNGFVCNTQYGSFDILIAGLAVLCGFATIISSQRFD